MQFAAEKKASYAYVQGANILLRVVLGNSYINGGEWLLFTSLTKLHNVANMHIISLIIMHENTTQKMMIWHVEFKLTKAK